AEKTLASNSARKDLCHPDGKGRRATGTIPKGNLADLVSEIGHGLRLQRITPAADRCGSSISCAADDAGGAVDREIDARRHGASGHHSHHADKRFEQHRTVADEASMTLAKNHLRRGAGRNQRMESADCAAGNGYETKRKNLSGKDRTSAVNEACERRH